MNRTYRTARPRVIDRPRLVEHLNEGLSAGCKFTLVSAQLLGDADHRTRLGAQPTQVAGGALLELIAAGECAGITIALYPVLRKWNVGLALGAVVFWSVEAM